MESRLFTPRNLWVRGSNLTGSSQPAKLPLFGGYSLDNLTLHYLAPVCICSTRVCVCVCACVYV